MLRDWSVWRCSNILPVGLWSENCTYMLAISSLLGLTGFIIIKYLLGSVKKGSSSSVPLLNNHILLLLLYCLNIVFHECVHKIFLLVWSTFFKRFYTGSENVFFVNVFSLRSEISIKYNMKIVFLSWVKAIFIGKRHFLIKTCHNLIHHLLL